MCGHTCSLSKFENPLHTLNNIITLNFPLFSMTYTNPILTFLTQSLTSLTEQKSIGEALNQPVS